MLQNFMKDDLFLRFVMSAEPLDDPGHPVAIVATANHSHTVMHDLHGLAFKRNNLPRVGDFGDSIAIPAARGHLHTRRVVQQDGWQIKVWHDASERDSS